jgi:hypothetical protein
MDHHMDVSFDTLLSALLEIASAQAEDQAMVPALFDLTEKLLGQESLDRVADLKRKHLGLDPRDGATSAVPDVAAFRTALEALLERANYRRLTDAELQAALENESVFQVRLHTDLRDFAELAVWVRGEQHRKETLSSWFGLRKRSLDVKYFRRVLFWGRLKDSETLGAKRAKTLPVAPGSAHLKLFADVPANDIEMLFPVSEVRMRTMDKVMIAVPALIGIAGMTTQVVLILGFMLGVALWASHQAGLPVEAKPVNWGAATAVLIATFGLYLFINRQLTNYRFRKTKFLRTLADNLYARSLDSHAGALHRVADEALDQERGEALSAWALLRQGTTTEAELDQRVEGFLKQRFGLDADFEVDDALNKLARLGLATKDTKEYWKAVPPHDAMMALRSHWSSLA